MKKILALVLLACMALAIVGCPAPAPAPGPQGPTEVDYKLGMGVVVSTASSTTGNAQVDATVATVVTDAAGKIVLCRIDVAQNKMAINDGVVDPAKIFKTKMELGLDYGMSTNPYSPDNDGDGRVLEWDVQTKEFEKYVVGKTAAEVEAIELQEANGHMIAVDEALLSAGCTIQITDYIEAVVAACNDEQGMAFKATPGSFTLGVAATTSAADSTSATAEADGLVAMYSDFAATVIADGKILAALNDAIQPKIAINVAGEIVSTTYVNTKRNLKEAYNMATWGASQDGDGDGRVLEWYLQSEAFSKHVVGMTGAEVAAMTTAANLINYQMSTDEALVAAGCTMQITGIKTVVALAATNAR